MDYAWLLLHVFLFLSNGDTVIFFRVICTIIHGIHALLYSKRKPDVKEEHIREILKELNIDSAIASKGCLFIFNGKEERLKKQLAFISRRILREFNCTGVTIEIDCGILSFEAF